MCDTASITSETCDTNEVNYFAGIFIQISMVNFFIVFKQILFSSIPKMTQRMCHTPNTVSNS